MSSVQSAFAQVGPREKYFVGTAVVATGTALVPTGNAAAGGVDTSVSDADFVAPLVTAGATAVGALYRDLGRTVTVYGDASLLAVEKYQKVALVNGPDTEGNDADAAAAGDLYVRVWAADPAKKVGVARVG